MTFYEQYQRYLETPILDLKSQLTATEYRLFFLLWQNRGQIVTKEIILERIFQDPVGVSEESLKWHLKNLRRKLKMLGLGDIIHCHKGLGYQIKKEVNLNFPFL
ncbi:helix-turn-helix domain-containing protein [Carboxydothermus pertinax]|uniref:Helix-turn-helix domain-containing protein n=2 Tax=Carboxydothermus pertinax TaxID=870242 RepID=A0A1L8CVS1_9THEO|nr:helix-turn-helix domain-containing protein [Carboxydothermus pertinax]